jgi:hypothetical protein
VHVYVCMHACMSVNECMHVSVCVHGMKACVPYVTYGNQCVSGEGHCSVSSSSSSSPWLLLLYPTDCLPACMHAHVCAMVFCLVSFDSRPASCRDRPATKKANPSLQSTKILTLTLALASAPTLNRGKFVDGKEPISKLNSEICTLHQVPRP